MQLNKIFLYFSLLSITFMLYGFTCSQNQTKPNNENNKNQSSNNTNDKQNAENNSSPAVNTNSKQSIELQVFSELNQARTNPKSYAKKLKAILKYYQGKLVKRPGEITMVTNEGASAVKECIRFLESTTPIQALKLSNGMALAAKDHVKDQSKSGAFGHNGSDGSSPFTRMNRYGRWSGAAGENIDYGNNIAERIVFSLLIDDGVPSRGHRENIFDKRFNFVGLAHGSHKKFKYLTVMTFASAYKEK